MPTPLSVSDGSRANTARINFVDLSGPWKAALVDAEINRSGTDITFDDTDWTVVQVPNHWATEPIFSESNGPILYRKSFRHQPNASQRTWLRLEGIMSQSEVWLDGEYLGQTSGYFAPHFFDVSSHLTNDIEHKLAIEVSCPSQEKGRSKRSLTGSLQTGPLAPAGCPGGIWKEVNLKYTGNTIIKYSRLLCTKATSTLAEISTRLVLDCAQAERTSLQTTIEDPQGNIISEETHQHMFAAGENRIEWKTIIENPEIWWPASYGEQPLYKVSVEVAGQNRKSDSCSWVTGLRTVQMNKFIWTINDQKIFLKSIAIGPRQRFLAQVSTDSYTQDIHTIKDCGLDMVRVHGHISDPSTYAAADKLGILIWQDLPLVGGYATSARKPAKSIARSAVDQLGHHPSIVAWGGHIEPNGSALPIQEPKHERLKDLSKIYQTAKHVLPSWNKTVFGPIIKKEIRSADQTRPVIENSGSLPASAGFNRTDVNLWLGWHIGSYKDMPKLFKKWPRLAEFPGGIGAQSAKVKEWGENAPQWETAETKSFTKYLPRYAYGNGKSWAYATREYQSALLKLQIETVRRLKFNPSGGFCVYALRDAEEDGGFGILEFSGQAKPAHAILSDVCRPVIIVADSPPTTAQAGQQLCLRLHVVNDLPSPLEDISLRAQARLGDWHTERFWKGSSDANTCTKVADFTFSLPAIVGKATIDLELISDDLLATNRYYTTVIPAAEI